MVGQVTMCVFVCVWQGVVVAALWANENVLFSAEKNERTEQQLYSKEHNDIVCYQEGSSGQLHKWFHLQSFV